MKRKQPNITVQNDSSKKAAFGSRAKLFIILIIAALIVAGVIAASFLWQNRSEEPPEEVAGMVYETNLGSDK